MFHTTRPMQPLDIEILAPIGRGAFGNVHKARFNGEDVACKLYKYVRDTSCSREAAILFALRHPNVIECIGYGTTSAEGPAGGSDGFHPIPPAVEPVPRPALVLPLWEGDLTNRVLQDDSVLLSIESVRRIMRQLLSGLAYIHALGYAHRDIKPQNILVNRRAEPEPATGAAHASTGEAASLLSPSSLQVCLTDFSLACSICNSVHGTAGGGGAVSGGMLQPAVAMNSESRQGSWGKEAAGPAAAAGAGVGIAGAGGAGGGTESSSTDGNASSTAATLPAAPGQLAASLSFLPPLAGDVVTLWYRAPELLLGASQPELCTSPAVDVWSAGCVLGELLCRAPVFRGQEAKQRARDKERDKAKEADAVPLVLQQQQPQQPSQPQAAILASLPPAHSPMTVPASFAEFSAGTKRKRSGSIVGGKPAMPSAQWVSTTDTPGHSVSVTASGSGRGGAPSPALTAMMVGVPHLQGDAHQGGGAPSPGCLPASASASAVALAVAAASGGGTENPSPASSVTGSGSVAGSISVSRDNSPARPAVRQPVARRISGPPGLYMYPPPAALPLPGPGGESSAGVGAGGLAQMAPPPAPAPAVAIAPARALPTVGSAVQSVPSQAALTTSVATAPAVTTATAATATATATQFQRDQARVVFSILGVPGHTHWPGVEALPHYPSVRPWRDLHAGFPEPGRGTLREHIQRLASAPWNSVGKYSPVAECGELLVYGPGGVLGSGGLTAVSAHGMGGRTPLVNAVLAGPSGARTPGGVAGLGMSSGFGASARPLGSSSSTGVVGAVGAAGLGVAGPLSTPAPQAAAGYTGGLAAVPSGGSSAVPAPTAVAGTPQLQFPPATAPFYTPPASTASAGTTGTSTVQETYAPLPPAPHLASQAALMSAIMARHDEYEDALDLLEAMLSLDPSTRPSAVQCLAHAFFTQQGVGKGAAMGGAEG